MIVGHNVRFDLGFLGAPPWPGRATRLGQPGSSTPAPSPAGWSGTRCRTAGWPRWRPTSAPSRRPTHRALDDAEATGEVLHGLLERAGCLGVLALEDLIDLPAVRATPA